MDSAQMHFCRDLFLVAARDGVKAEARRAKQRERSGQPRGLSEEYESILRSVTEKPVAGAGTARKGILSDEDLMDDDEEDDWDEEEDGGTAEDTSGGSPNAAPVPPRQVDKDVIAAADAAGAALPVEQQHAEAGEHQDDALDHDDGLDVDAAADKKKPARAAEPEREQRADAIAPAADGPIVDAPFRRQKRSVEGDDVAVAARRRPRTKRAKPLGNSAFEPARIIVNPRCVTTYAGVSHTQLALDLFGSGDDKEPAPHEGGKYALEEWSTAPETFVRDDAKHRG